MRKQGEAGESDRGAMTTASHDPPSSTIGVKTIQKTTSPDAVEQWGARLGEGSATMVRMGEGSWWTSWSTQIDVDLRLKHVTSDGMTQYSFSVVQTGTYLHRGVATLPHTI